MPTVVALFQAQTTGDFIAQEGAAAMNGSTRDGAIKSVAPAKVASDGLEGVPALSACQIGIRWAGDATDSTRSAL